MEKSPDRSSSRALSASSTNNSTYVDEIKDEVMVNYLYQQQCSNLWGQRQQRRIRRSPVAEKSKQLHGMPASVTKLVLWNGLCCSALNSSLPDAVDVPLMNGLRFAAFVVASEALLVVWDDDALQSIQRAKAVESEVMELVWKTGEPEEGRARRGGTRIRVQCATEEEEEDDESDEREQEHGGEE
ncbi:hypothetical protein MMC07_001591 [Pseudocyphellaria aurata]|nr:hypothetical protein [Pseudocyphellaria aurata]